MVLAKRFFEAACCGPGWPGRIDRVCDCATTRISKTWVDIHALIIPTSNARSYNRLSREPVVEPVEKERRACSFSNAKGCKQKTLTPETYVPGTRWTSVGSLLLLLFRLLVNGYLDRSYVRGRSHLREREPSCLTVARSPTPSCYGKGSRGPPLASRFSATHTGCSQPDAVRTFRPRDPRVSSIFCHRKAIPRTSVGFIGPSQHLEDHQFDSITQE